MLPRLLHVFSTFDPGGPEVRTANLINATKESFEHYIVAMDGCYGALPRVRGDAVAEVLPAPPLVPKDVAGIAAPFRPPVVLWRILRNARWMQQQIRRVRPNLLLTYNLGAASALLAASVSNCCPVIHSETGITAEELVRVKTLRVLLRRVATHRISALVVPSRALERVAATAFKLRAPVIRIPNGVDVRRLQPSDGSEMRRRLGLEPPVFVVGCVGHLRAEKGHLRLLDAFHAAGIPNSRLLILGDGPMRPVIDERIKELGIGGQVMFPGRIDYVGAWYAAMDVFALASDTEQMPMALLEAMACGLPAVCMDVGDCREIVGTQLVPAVFGTDDINGFAGALRSFSRDGSLRRDTGTQNRRRCVDEYDSEKMISRYRELYIHTISGVCSPQAPPAGSCQCSV